MSTERIQQKQLAFAIAVIVAAVIGIVIASLDIAGWSALSWHSQNYVSVSSRVVSNIFMLILIPAPICYLGFINMAKYRAVWFRLPLALTGIYYFVLFIMRLSGISGDSLYFGTGFGISYAIIRIAVVFFALLMLAAIVLMIVIPRHTALARVLKIVWISSIILYSVDMLTFLADDIYSFVNYGAGGLIGSFICSLLLRALDIFVFYGMLILLSGYRTMENSLPPPEKSTGIPLASYIREQVAPAPKAAPVQQPVQNQTVFCTNCGAPLSPGSSFCVSCGTKV
jgi:MFS family permease